MQTKIEKRIIDELRKAKEVQKCLLEIQIEADKIGYETQFGLDTNEKTAKSAYLAGYQLGVQDGYIECLQRMLIMYEEDKDGIC